MSPDDTKDPNAAPDFSSVPLPEENPIRSPYAPASGTLGDVADDLDKPVTTPSEEPAPTPTPSGAFTVPEDTQAPVSNPAATAPTSDATIPSAGTLGAQEEAFIPGVAADKVQGHIPDPNAPVKKGKGKLIGLICGAVVLVAAVVLGVIFIPKLINNNGGNSGGNGHTGPLFAANSFVVKELTATESSIVEDGKYLLFTNDGKKIGADRYDYLGDIIDGAMLAKRNGQMGIINDKAETVVEFGKYQEIVEYGGLYGATDENGKRYLIDGTGQVIREYTDQFDNYSTIEANGRAAYTLFSLGGGKYDVYSARGEKLTTIEAGDSVPTISSNNFTGDNSVTAIFYDGKMILYGDSSNELARKDGVSHDRLLIKDADVKNKVYLFSTVAGESIGYDTYIMPTDGRVHAVLIGDNYSDIPAISCPLVTYERMEGDQIGVLVCHVTTTSRRYIDNTGAVTTQDISSSSLRYSGVGDYGAIKMYPAGINRYIMQSADNNGYSIYVDGKPVKTFRDEAATEPLSGKMYKASGPTYYNPGDRYPYYLVMRYTSTENPRVFIDKPEYLVEATFYDSEGNTVCSLDKEIAQKYNPYYFKGFDSNGLAIIGELNYVLINKKCEVVTERDYGGISHQGYFYSGNSYGANRVHHYLNAEGKVAEGINHDSTIMRGFREAPDVTILTSDSIMTIKGKILERAYGKNFEHSDKYIAFVAQHGGEYRIVYYLRDSVEQFYETDIDANFTEKSEK